MSTKEPTMNLDNHVRNTIVVSAVATTMPLSAHHPAGGHGDQQRKQAMTTIHADELRPGDVMIYGGNVRHITRVDREDTWAWPIAADDTGWAIALSHQLIDVQRVAA
jgi:hypothetical protein